jgi:hypothetical protein
MLLKLLRQLRWPMHQQKLLLLLLLLLLHHPLQLLRLLKLRPVRHRLQ